LVTPVNDGAVKQEAVMSKSKKTKLYEVQYAIPVEGMTVIEATSVEDAKKIAEDSSNYSALYRGATITREGVVVKGVELSKVHGETADNVGGAVVAVPRVKYAA
jgi:hypothetical protein